MARTLLPPNNRTVVWPTSQPYRVCLSWAGRIVGGVGLRPPLAQLAANTDELPILMVAVPLMLRHPAVTSVDCPTRIFAGTVSIQPVGLGAVGLGVVVGVGVCVGVSVGVGDTGVSVGVGDTGVSVGVGDTGVSVGVGDTGVSVGVGDTGVSVGVGDTGVSVGVGDTGVSVSDQLTSMPCRVVSVVPPYTIFDVRAA